MKKIARVEIPRDPTEAIGLFKQIKEKHEAMGAESPLKGLDWERFVPALTRGAANDADADEFRQKSETAIGDRNKDLPAVMEGLRSARDVLIGLNRANPKKLTEWKFVVIDAAEASAAPHPAADAPAS